VNGYGRDRQVHKRDDGGFAYQGPAIPSDSAAVSARTGISPPGRAAIQKSDPSERLTMSVPVTGLQGDTDPSVSHESRSVTPLNDSTSEDALVDLAVAHRSEVTA